MLSLDSRGDKTHPQCAIRYDVDDPLYKLKIYIGLYIFDVNKRNFSGSGQTYVNIKVKHSKSKDLYIFEGESKDKHYTGSPLNYIMISMSFNDFANLVKKSECKSYCKIYERFGNFDYTLKDQYLSY